MTDRRLGLAERIRAVLSIEPSKGAVEQRGRWRSYADLAQLMAQVDAELTARKLGEGAPVGMLLRNRPAHLAALLGVLTTKRCVVTINPFQSPDKVARDIEALRCPVLIADEQDWQIPEIRQAVEACGSAGLALRETSSETSSEIDRLAIAAVPEFAEVGAGPYHEPLPGIAVLMLTSGTTGPAKRIPLQYKNFEKALLDALFYEAGGQEIGLKRAVVVAMNPLVHIGGIWATVSAIIAGRSICLLEKFAVDIWVDAIKRYRPKLVPLNPTAAKMIFDANVAKEDLASLIAIRSATAPLDPTFREAFEARYGIPVLDAYGATEFAGGVAGWTLADHKEFARSKRDSVGRVQPGCQLRVIDPQTFAELPAGTVGLLEVRAQHVGNGDWVRTTDLAEVDADGFLYIRGRADDAIIRGGFKVLPGDVAKVFLLHPGVQDVSVVGIKDERLGAVPVVAVELKAGVARPDETESMQTESIQTELMQWARKHLTSYMVPVAIKVVDELPRTPSHKVSQPGVRELFGGEKP